MDYNTTRNKLRISEYGRNIQKMVEYLLTIEDREKRTQLAKFIVQVMGQMTPQSRDMGDSNHKLWDHIHIISDYKLDVDAPYPPPTPQEVSKKPSRLEYNSGDIRFRHYGKNIISIIEKANDYPEGPERDALVKTIANHMKKSYLIWNRESVSDELITSHLKTLSNNKLVLDEDVRLNQTHDILAMTKKKKTKKDNFSSGSNNNRSRKDKGYRSYTK
ncbi:MAG: DUF4290 domain-containing protein [Bacteroidales bacterium]|nr:DUF4290 domain-containing protein [Bacteroidales bacterium]